MTARRPTQTRLQAPAAPAGNLLEQLLDPIDLLAEVIFSVLIIAGYLWGRYTGANPWKTGLLLLGAGVIMMVIAIPLGG